MLRRRWIVTLLMLSVAALIGVACSSRWLMPGETGSGTILPNRWRLTPAGATLPLGDLPLNMALSADGRTLAVTNNGFSRQFVSVIDVSRNKIVQELPMAKSFFGLCFHPDGRSLYASGGADDQILVWRQQGDTLRAVSAIPLVKEKNQKLIPFGLAITPDGRQLFVAESSSGTLSLVDMAQNTWQRRVAVGTFPYDVRYVAASGKIYVSLWGGAAVAVVDANSFQLVRTIPVGDHPNMMLLDRQSARLFVACANTDEVCVIDTRSDQLLDRINLQPYPGAPFGSTPNGLALSADQKTLYVANATNNDVAVIDVSGRSGHQVKGLIPVGWYPTAVACIQHTLYVANGKGMISKPNPKGPGPYSGRKGNLEYIANLFNGVLSIVAEPDERTLAAFTKQVVANNGFNETQHRLAEGPQPVAAQVIPRRLGEPSLIKYVIYIIKENRTYDQIFGDLAQGNGDPSLCLFGREVTPNHHALAEEYVLLDNFYVDAEVSADGHEWSMGAIATDFVEKTWPSSYSGRGLPYPAEGSFAAAFPSNGYIWESVGRKGLSYRSYGEFIEIEGDSMVARHPALVGHFSQNYRSWDMDYPDTLRAAAFIKELVEFEKNGQMPSFLILRVINDHTYGTSPGKLSPRAMVADNDLALGRIVEAVSKSRFWPETAIFVLEDDAQNGPDHVDAHRSPALVISPYVRRGHVDHTLYDTVSMLRTMEMILGVHPLSQYDAAAFPMVTCFTDKPDFKPYTSLRPTVSMSERNTATSWGADASLRMDFSREDATPEFELNEIVWKSVKGADSEMPMPIFRRSMAGDDDDDD